MRTFLLGWFFGVMMLMGCGVTGERVEPSPMPSQNIEISQASPTQTGEDALPPGTRAEFPKTDFSRHSVPFSEILAGGPPRDGIPAIDRPRFVALPEAEAWLEDPEPVLVVQVGEDVRAYPIQILIWHEIVNDTVGGKPLVITYCPLCNTGIAFERTVDGRVLDFGTTGRLRYSNLIMYDWQTESWWQQATGEAIVGTYTGTRLTFYPARMMAWAQFREAYPQGRVLSRETGYVRDYGRNPYIGYDRAAEPFLYRGPRIKEALPLMARVYTIATEAEAVAYPYEVVRARGVVHDRVAGRPVVLFWVPGVASPLDAARIDRGREVGTVLAYGRTVDDRVLTFRVQDGAVVDQETSTRWDVLTGRAIAGPLQGQALAPVAEGVHHFWFSWYAFRPDTRIYMGP